MSGTDEEILSLFKIACSGVIELLLTIGTIDQSGEDSALTRCRSAMPLLPDLLHLVKDFLCDDGGVHTIASFKNPNG